MDNLKLLGKRIKELRGKNKLTQDKFSEIIGLDVKQISNIETGACFTTMAMLEKMAECFGVEVSELFNFSHLKSKKELVPILIKRLKGASEGEIQLIAKIINSVLR